MNPLQPTAIEAKRRAYRLLQLVMLGDVVIGVLAILAGFTVLEMPALAIVGAVLAIAGLVMALLFRRLARRPASAQRVRSSWVRPR